MDIITSEDIASAYVGQVSDLKRRIKALESKNDNVTAVERVLVHVFFTDKTDTKYEAKRMDVLNVGDGLLKIECDNYIAYHPISTIKNWDVLVTRGSDGRGN